MAFLLIFSLRLTLTMSKDDVDGQWISPSVECLREAASKPKIIINFWFWFGVWVSRRSLKMGVACTVWKNLCGSI